MLNKKATNPFKPTAGAEPPVLIGRDKAIRDFVDGLEEGVGSPGRLMRITGPRGSGKTVLLTELGDEARKRGWLVIDETARSGLVQAISDSLSRSITEADASVGIDLGILKAEARVGRGSGSGSFRSVLTSASGRIGKKGILITVDEVQDADRDDIAEIAIAVQHLIREGRNVAFVFAGITTGVMDFINDSSLTFLRRAKAEELGPIPIDEVARALSRSFSSTGMEIGGRVLSATAEATHGYAYLIQLVGYNVWRECRGHIGDSAEVSVDDVTAGARVAADEYAESVLLPALKGVTERAMRYLVEMSKSDGPSSTGKIAKGMGVSSTSLTSARRSLISRQIIEPTARGYVDFSLPVMREYIHRNQEDLLSRFGQVSASSSS